MVDLLKSTASPIVWVLVLIALGLILAKRLRKKPAPKVGWFLVLSGLLILYLFSINPVSKLLAYSLECRYEPPSEEVLSTLDVVIILGGGMRTSGGFRQCPEASGITYSRLCNGIRIFKRSGAGTLVLSGSGLTQSTQSEAGVMKALAIELGVQEDKIVAEAKSRNTMDQAVKLAELLSATKNKRIGLVTSALHMMRSERAFKSRFPDHTIVPVPVSYLYTPPKCRIKTVIPSAGALLESTCAVHELIGMIWYTIRY